MVLKLANKFFFLQNSKSVFICFGKFNIIWVFCSCCYFHYYYQVSKITLFVTFNSKD